LQRWFDMLLTALLLASLPAERIALPAPRKKSRVSIEQALERRRSARTFAPRALTEQELSQLLWAAQGITGPKGLRTAPSAGALYPLEIFVALPEGVYRYEPETHALHRTIGADVRPALGRAAVGQEHVASAPAVLVFTARIARTRVKYGARSEQYVFIESGHAAQNVLLQATAIALRGVPVGAFDEAEIRKILQLDPASTPTYLLPVGGAQ
jgi:SagB-type dehydrogenase family enzyme